MAAWRSARLVTVAASCLLVAPCCRGEARSDFPDAEVGQWDSIPAEELEALWDIAQRSAGVIAIEPYTSVIGLRAAKKKTWAVADGALKFFLYGYEPIWFPADVVRRTVCTTGVRWSYFWHGLSGDESDLHPWFPGGEAFRDLLGDAGPALGSGALDAAACRDVAGGAEGERCIYGEVSPTAGFDTWFCGQRGAACRAQVNATHRAAPPDFAAAQKVCTHGPFVLERVHGWRPEIHPAELTWARAPASRDAWMFALVPDTSKRFDQASHFSETTPSDPDPWRPWSAERPVELWIAFTQDMQNPRLFDLSKKVLGKTAAAARQVTVELPAPGRFTSLSHGLEGVLLAAKTWPAGDKRHGFLVARTVLRKSEAVVMRLTDRSAGESAPPAEIQGAVQAPALGVREEAVVGSVRMLGEVRQQGAVIGSVTINTLVRFDPRRPAVHADEEATDRLNEALKGEPAQRAQAFGKERPFRVEWDLTAVRANGERVPVETASPAQLVGSAVSGRVRVAAFPGPATEEIRVKTPGAAPELAPAERKPVSLGQLVLSVPSGVTVTGEGRVFYIGTQTLGLPEPAVKVTLRYPPWSYKDEWELVGDVLGELDTTSAPLRLTRLREDACAPAQPAECGSGPLAPSVAKRLQHPAERWPTLRELQTGDRPFARFVWLFARDIRWDGRVSNDERDLLKKLLGSVPQPREGAGGGR